MVAKAKRTIIKYKDPNMLLNDPGRRKNCENTTAQSSKGTKRKFKTILAAPHHSKSEKGMHMTVAEYEDKTQQQNDIRKATKHIRTNPDGTKA